MPPRWPRQPDRKDPAYRRLDDRMNFAVHVAIFAACNSGLWFFHNLQHATWPWAKWVTGVWALLILIHMIYIFGIADYSELVPGSVTTAPKGFQPNNSEPKGFQPKSKEKPKKSAKG